jgi:hypothetical protein
VTQNLTSKTATQKEAAAADGDHFESLEMFITIVKTNYTYKDPF